MSPIYKILITVFCLIFASIVVIGRDVAQQKDLKGEESMTKQSNPIDRLDFLIGTWHMEYKSHQGSGTGIFKRAFDDKYVFFDYSVSSPAGETGAAHGIFAWDTKDNIYRDWWFENSGNFTQAACNFINEETLLMYWQDTLLIQTFQKIGSDKVELKMKQSNARGEYEVILEVEFTKQK